METLLDIQKSGKIRYVGVSNYSVDQMQECLKYGQIVSLQPMYSMLERDIEEEMYMFLILGRLKSLKRLRRNMIRLWLSWQLIGYFIKKE
jgi:predicted oxidoreductase